MVGRSVCYSLFPAYIKKKILFTHLFAPDPHGRTGWKTHALEHAQCAAPLLFWAARGTVGGRASTAKTNRRAAENSAGSTSSRRGTVRDTAVLDSACLKMTCVVGVLGALRNYDQEVID